MITKERLAQTGKSIMSNAFTSTGFSSQFNELRNIKVTIQTQITDRLSQEELYDIALSKKNDNVIAKLIAGSTERTAPSVMSPQPTAKTMAFFSAPKVQPL